MIQLSASQQSVHDAILEWFHGGDEVFATLSGYAGTGKTTIVSFIVGALAGDFNVAIAAPTNKAVGVLEAKIAAFLKQSDIGAEFEARSIHSLLGLKLEEQEDGTSKIARGFNEPSIGDYHLVVCDEGSMLGPDLFAQVASSVASSYARTRVLFVGDPAQLPPVGETEISPVFRVVGTKFELSEIVRQAAENPIIGLSMQIRAWIEAGYRPDAGDIADRLPAEPGAASVVAGDVQTIRGFALGAIGAKQDVRIIAYTNRAVLQHNAAIHAALYPDSPFPFVAGERVIAQKAFQIRNVRDGATDEEIEQIEGGRVDQDEGRKMRRQGSTKAIDVINSEELDVLAIEPAKHPRYPNVPACRITLRNDQGESEQCLVAVDQNAVQRQLSAEWVEFAKIKAAEALATDVREKSRLARERKAQSRRAWMLARAFAPIRHSYAITSHKSQGSTYQAVIVDLNDLNLMRSPFEFGRSLYVAATRASDFLCIVA